MTICCNRMALDLNQQCSMHSHRSQCPDALVGRLGEGYGLYIHDGGCSLVEIAFCPWCGTKLAGVEEEG